jgi:hypothetical protein
MPRSNNHQVKRHHPQFKPFMYLGPKIIMHIFTFKESLDQTLCSPRYLDTSIVLLACKNTPLIYFGRNKAQMDKNKTIKLILQDCIF